MLILHTSIKIKHNELQVNTAINIGKRQK